MIFLVYGKEKTFLKIIYYYKDSDTLD